MYIIRFCFAYLLFFFAVILLQVIPSLDFFFLKKKTARKDKTNQMVQQKNPQDSDKEKEAA